MNAVEHLVERIIVTPEIVFLDFSTRVGGAFKSLACGGVEIEPPEIELVVLDEFAELRFHPSGHFRPGEV